MKLRARRYAFTTLTATSALAIVLVGAPATADDGDVEVLNTETVQVYMSSSGDIQTQRVYEQLELKGSGEVELRNPISLEGLRNLDGFSGFETSDGEQLITTTVDGEQQLRTVSDFDGDLPLEISVDYRLDGESVEPGDIVGESGSLEVQFTVENVTGSKQDLSYPDGKGGTVTTSADVPIPIVGSLTTVAPASFDNVTSGEANMAGDGKGGMKVSFTMTLFPPIGSTKASFGYTADIVDGVVPRVDVAALPVNPLESPSFKTASTSYQGGADTGSKLAAGATEIDANLLRLRDGAAELLSGLLRLNDGAGRLADGTGRLDDGAGRLTDGSRRLRDGADTLADGAGDAAAGSRRLADGAGRLREGLGDLGDGTGDLNNGADQLASGQKALANGLGQLYKGVEALPKDVRDQLAGDPDFNRLLGALNGIAVGIGDSADGPSTATLMGGLQRLRYGLDNPSSMPADCVAKRPECGATNGLDLIASRLSGALNGPVDVDGTIAKLKATILTIKGQASCDAACDGYVDAVAAGVEAKQQASLTELRTGITGIAAGIRARITEPGAGLDQIRAGLSTGVDPVTCASNPRGCGIREAAQFLAQYGVPALVEGITNNISNALLANIGKPTAGCDPQKTLRCAAERLADGGTALTEGIDQLVAGVTMLKGGGVKLATGAGELSEGLGRLDGGAGRLAEGTSELHDGASKLADGTGKLRDGAGQLADGTGRAAEGAPQLRDGAQRLSDEGTKKLVEAGESTAQNYGQMVAVLEAGAERAKVDHMAYGAPADSLGLTAYSFVIEGEDGEGDRNLTRGLAGLALLGAGAAVFSLRRRLA